MAETTAEEGTLRTMYDAEASLRIHRALSPLAQTVREEEEEELDDIVSSPYFH